MRLLRLQSCGSSNLEEFSEDRVPPYAILSHTWGQMSDEITLKVLVGSYENKAATPSFSFAAVKLLKTTSITVGSISVVSISRALLINGDDQLDVSLVFKGAEM